uniref:(-)-cyperene synthase n=1 Tax=Artabotrys hexapetalus TaxID=225833 RepID=A0AA96Q2Y6_ARTHX|nr:(-)-cyperene synthase [Artabotrys hexapetalus]
MSLTLGTSFSDAPTTKSPIRSGKKEMGRSSANFHPNVWGDRFVMMPSKEMETDASTKQRAEMLKQEVKKMLHDVSGSLQELNLINEIQRLGVAYHFEAEISNALERIYNREKNENGINDCDLHAVALRFRLLRQHGYNVSSDVFKKFKDENGEFEARFRNDVRGLLSLYEAAYFGTQEDGHLDEAIAFTTKHLKSLLPHLSSPLSDLVKLALDLPLLKRIERLQSKHFISIYQQDEDRNNVLLEFAKIDFNILQALHRKELNEITRWWNESDLPRKLPFIRDRLVECYIWMLELYYEPQYSQSRRMTTILLILTSSMDDIYDVYGKLEELERYTVAVERWEREALDQLPDYMRVHLGVLLTVVENFEDELGKEGKSFHLAYVKKAFAELTKAYIKEARWANAEHVPALEEYVDNAVVSSAYPLITTMSLLGMGKVATKEAFEWTISLPNAVRQCSMICRLVNDIMSNQSEQERVHVASAVQCCMKEFSTTYEEACKILQEKIARAWKDLNKECLHPIPVSLELIRRPLNLARAIEFYYQCRDGYSDSAFEIKDYITMLLVEPAVV